MEILVVTISHIFCAPGISYLQLGVAERAFAGLTDQPFSQRGESSVGDDR